MYLVKSCKKEFNVTNSGTVKIGTLHEYRETESEQILDKEEGCFKIFFDLTDKYIKINMFNYLNHSHNSSLNAKVNMLNIQSRNHDCIKVTYDAEYNWTNHNRFIFCLSKLEDHRESKSIFKDYNDYWYVSIFKKNQLINLLEKAVFEEVKQRVINGEKVFQKNNVDPNKLTIRSHSQDIIYTDRSLFLNNDNFDSNEDILQGIFNDIKYLKPDVFKKEFEFRIVFDFFENELLLVPAIKSLIIKENISSLIRQPECSY